MATGDGQTVYGSTTGFTITIDSLADGALRESTAVSNATTKYVNVMYSGVIEGASGAVGVFNVYAYGMTETGKYTGSCTGTNAAYGAVAGQNKANLKPLISVTVDAGTTEEFEWGPIAIADAFGGVVPEEFGTVVEWIDDATAALHSASNTISYQGITYNTE